MKPFRLVLFFLLVLPAFRAFGQTMPAERYRVEVEIRRWRPSLVSDLEVGETATPIVPTEDLGLQDERGIDFRGAVRLSRRLKVRGSRVAFEYQAAQSLSRPLRFAGVELGEGASVDTRLELEQWKVGVELDLIRSRDGFLAIVGDYSRLDGRVGLVAAGQEELQSGLLRVDLPVLGLKGRIYLTPGFSVTAEATGMRRGDQEVITDLEAVATYNLGRHVALSFGYRNFYGKLDEAERRSTFRLRGSFASFTLRI